ncbi:cytochrome c556 [Dongia mobilis]|uniref:Cytochrome c556 n=1 Tax=Dongia mobilis TaxID=578943 RepID=A0A4R6WQB3_9PROT|nr:cytochrome c [Dongia mobilis]TDQ81440.1 cytochrome c556 [Dongia mobilis]
MRKSTISATILAVLIGVAGSISLVQADDAILAQREQAMKGMGAQMKTIKDLVGSGGPAGDVVAPAQKIAEIAATIPGLFPEGSGGDEVRPEIWQNWNDFVAKAQALGNEATMLAAAAEGGDMATVGAQFEKVGGACSACHKAYRE